MLNPNGILWGSMTMIMAIVWAVQFARMQPRLQRLRHTERPRHADQRDRQRQS